MSELQGLHGRDSFAKSVSGAIAGTERTSVRPSKVEEYLTLGWKVKKIGKTSTSIERLLPEHRRLELKLWLLCYKLGFYRLSSPAGAILVRAGATRNQLDVVAVSEDVALVFECKCSTTESPKAFDASIDCPKLKDHVDEVRKILKDEGSTPKVKGVFCLAGQRPSKADRARVDDTNQHILTESTLDYYLDLVDRIGDAAYYQFLGEIISGESVPSLRDLKVPCVKTKIGNATAYQLALTPEILLKLAYVAHRVAGGSDGYQRMVTKSRIKAMRHFIEQGGYFPTNIVINFRDEQRRPRFEPSSSEFAGIGDTKYGSLILPPTFGCAWVIDGQHRLLAYAGHRWAETATLPATAFDGLAASKEAELFEDINSRQKKVSAALLSELFAALHIGSSNAQYQVKAMASATVSSMKVNKTGPFFGRILGADERQNELKCITLKYFFDGLSRPGFFYRKFNGDRMQTAGPFWLGEPLSSVERAADILEHWFDAIRSGCSEEWALGEPGIVATNRGIAACLRVLRDVFERLRRSDPDFDSWSEKRIKDEIENFGLIAGEAFAKLRLTDFENARTSYGAGAVPEYHYTIVRFIRAEGYADFESEGFEKWQEEKHSVNVNEAMTLVKDLEHALSTHVRSALQQTYDSQAWMEVPPLIRRKAGGRQQERDPNDDIWKYLELIDYRTIIQKHWALFKDVMGLGKQGKEEGTKWIVELNEIRRDAYHASGTRLKAHQVSTLRELATQLSENGVVELR